MSFRDPVSFSMIATRERQHGDRLSKIPKYQTRILPIATIYGGNASGKSNFFHALVFVKRMVIIGPVLDLPLPVQTYQLDSSSINKPSRFKLELLIDEIMYEFSFAVTKKEVVEEKLVQITSRKEKILYDRKRNKVNFAPRLDKDQFLHFAFQGTKDNQLFLTNSVSQKVDTFRPIYDWFKDTLEIVAPDSKFNFFENFFNENHPLYNTMNKMLLQLDTGISRLGGVEDNFEKILISDVEKIKTKENVKKGMTVRLIEDKTDERFIITQKDGELITKRLVSFHQKSDGTEAEFKIWQESDGTLRVIELLPAFHELSSTNSKKVYVIDEVDRSLHPLLTKQLIELYLSSCNSDSRTQLLITTHDVLLMDQSLFRRDEIWITERNRQGSSELYSFSDYKDARYDKDIRKSYLQGRLGGIPKILYNNALKNQKEDD
ncbi:MAG TPA: ATP-binding protein [Planctomycetota bacterium]|nr:ATP-binding protein [Planctomycetota bacterium]